ncbi:cation:proton antiporter [Chryseomicrobium excrementi]|uniref:Cation:proton antiporter n=2 Tax=Bacillales TaxID=1385 RepID=A0A2M9EZB6_9BACL|nr:cation:proton antiporter [Chryseomicrobium excrementi]
MEMKNWKKRLFAIYTGQFFSLLSSAAVQFSIIWWLTDATGSPLVLALAGVAGFLPQALIGPIAGTIIDRYSRKMMMILADMTVAFGSFILFITMYFQEPSLVLIISVLILRSIATAFHVPSLQASIPLLVPEEHYTKVAGWGQMVSSITNIVGPAIGVSLLAIATIEWVLLLDILGAVIATSILLFIHIPKVTEDKSAAPLSFVTEMKEGYQAVTQHRLLIKLVIVMTIVAVLYIPLGTYFPLMVRNHFERGVIEAGIVEITFAIGLILGGVLVGFVGDRYSKGKTMAAGMALLGGALLISGLLVPSAFFIFIGLSFFMGLSGPLFSAPFYAFIQTEIEPRLLGRAFSFITSLSLLATPLGFGVAGIIAEVTDIAVLFAVTGCLIVVNAIITYKMN